jgi:hypothetical protein
VQIIVFFVNEEKLGAAKMLEYINRMKEDQIYRAVLILQKKLSGPANSERMLVKNTYRIEDVRALYSVNHVYTEPFASLSDSVPQLATATTNAASRQRGHVVCSSWRRS